MTPRSSLLPNASIRPGGKEEIRASILKPYLLRIRQEHGERAARTVLASAEIDPASVDTETGWISTVKAKRALKAIEEVLGTSGLRHRAEWTTHPETLGTYVRMLRVARNPVDAYRYLAANAREVTRIGDWELEELGGDKDDAKISRVRLTYRIRADADDPLISDAKGELPLCTARQAELEGFPRIWGLADATLEHPRCITAGADMCVYDVGWSLPQSRLSPWIAAGAAVVFGLVTGILGGIVAGIAAGILGGALGAGAGFMFDRNKREAGLRIFEKNRISALERGLELKGDGAASQTGELIGTVLAGKYRIGRKIGSGGIGAVYAAEHTTLGHEVAVKVLRGAAARDGSEIARLRREAYIQVHIEHPNIARVLDLDQMADGSIFVVMERLHGKSLAEKLGKAGIIAPGEALRVFGDVCRALQAAHEKDVVHRDLKPGNIFLCSDGTSKVLDFGMSKLSSAESLTQEGFTLGTPEYMAPEQCIGAQVLPQTDLYSLGVVMYEALTGELPITSPNRRELLDLHQRKAPTPMRDKRPDLPIPPELDAAVMKCLKKRVPERPTSAMDLLRMLEAVPREGLTERYPSSRLRKVDRKADLAKDLPIIRETIGEFPEARLDGTDGSGKPPKG